MLKAEVFDEGFWQILDQSQPLKRLYDHFCFTEGPIWNPKEKHLTFSDIICNTIYRHSEKGLSVFRRPSYMANGNSHDLAGHILSCEHATSRISRSLVDGTGYEVLVSHFEGKALNSPNDIIVKSNGDIYFTDPTSGRSAMYGVPREPELSFAGVYRFRPSSRQLELLIDDFSKPNGLCFSLDEKYLFVNDTDKQHIRRFELAEDGLLKEGEIWANTQGELAGVPDGMKFDNAGHLFCTGPGGIHVFNDEAKCLGIILMPEKTANFCWGDEDMKSLYITASSSLYRLRTYTAGKSLYWN
ncbi:MAG: SMP-30/gluconolactonase/LRE family protein [Deinococcales bacterium]